MHPGEHLVGLADLDVLVTLGQGVFLVLQRGAGLRVNHGVDRDWALVLDPGHGVHFNRWLFPLRTGQDTRPSLERGWRSSP